MITQNKFNPQVTNLKIMASRLLVAIDTGNIQEAMRLITLRADLDSCCRHTGNTALIKASINGHIDIVVALIAAGANVNTANKAGNTAIYWAKCNGYTKIVNFLIANGAVEPEILTAHGILRACILEQKNWIAHIDKVRKEMSKQGK